VKGLRTLLLIAWASPWSFFGLLVGVIGLGSGGRVQRRGQVLEFWGGGVEWFLRTFPLVVNASAVTFGHVILGRSQEALDASREHELVHVRQYERWGPMFVPAYLACWVLLWLQGRSGYFDNPFEREAYGRAE
jgi:hypothetical protein